MPSDELKCKCIGVDKPVAWWALRKRCIKEWYKYRSMYASTSSPGASGQPRPANSLTFKTSGLVYTVYVLQVIALSAVSGQVRT